jgi:pilus assembly protein CpaE
MARTPAAIVIDQDIESRFEAKQAVRGSGLTFAGESGFGQEAIALASDTRPDVIFVALNSPMERPLQTVDSIQAMHPTTPVIGYAKAPDTEAWRSSMRAGVRDLLLMPLRAEVVRDAVVKAMSLEESRRLRLNGHPAHQVTTGTVITVFGAKGGIGKSTIAVNLAVAFAQQGTSTVIVDLDTGFGDVTAMLDLRPERRLDELVRDTSELTRDDLKRFMTGHEASGLDVLASPPVLAWKTIEPDGLRRVLELLAKYYDKVVVDTSGTLNDVSEVALDVATMVLWVTTSEFTSVRDSIEALEALDSLSIPRERTRIVLNSSSADDAVRPQTVKDVLQMDVFWQVPYDRRVRQGTHFGQPIVVSAPQSIAARSMVDLAHVIAGGRPVTARKKSGSSFRWRPGARPANAEGV